MSLLFEPAGTRSRQDELDTATWARVFREAAELGVLQVHLSGGEPASRRDLEEIARRADRRALHQPHHLGGRRPRARIARSPSRRRPRADLDPGQRAESADHIAGYEGAFARKSALAAEVVRLGLPLTVNMVVHRANIDRIHEMVALALPLGASRVEIAHVQYYGWALKNRATPDADARAGRAGGGEVEELRESIRAASSSMRSCRITTRACPSRAWAAGAGARSTSRRPGACCRATPPKSFPDWSSGRCAIMRSRTSGGTRRRSAPSAEPTGCRSRAQLRDARRISAAAAARRSC